MIGENYLPTPDCESDFTVEWAKPILEDYFKKTSEIDPNDIKVLEVRAKKNELQGILSITYVVDVEYEGPNEDGEMEIQTKHLFAKVPLKDDPNFASVNVRELIMLTKVLPQLQEYLDTECDGFFRLPMPEVVHCYYDGNGKYDVFVLGNLLADEYQNFDDDKNFDEDHLKSLLECLAQLHGTGLAYKHKVGGSHHQLKDEFPGLEEQIQLSDILDNEKMHQFFRQHFRAFLHYLEDSNPALSYHTEYMQKMHKHILKVMKVLDKCGYERLISICHGDAKPNNFMFRNICIDLDDEELSCEGLQSILIDWQGGFVGSVANDLMWAIYPFLEANSGKQVQMYSTALEYYHEQISIVLDSFHCSLEDLNLPQTLSEFKSLVKKCLVLEFIVVTVVKPILMIPNPKKLLKWHKETERNKTRRFKKAVEKPEFDEVFTSCRFTRFCHLYFKIATALGAFQELGKIYFDVMKDNMFETEFDDFDSDVDSPDPDLFYRIINYKLPKIPQIPWPHPQKLRNITDLRLQWRRLKQKPWLLAATSCGVMASFTGFAHYFYSTYYFQNEM